MSDTHFRSATLVVVVADVLKPLQFILITVAQTMALEEKTRARVSSQKKVLTRDTPTRDTQKVSDVT